MARVRKTDVVELVEILDDEPAKSKTTGNPMFEDWKSGISIKELVVKYGCTRPQCRRKLTEAAGGKAAFKALRAEGAGGSLAAFGGKRGTRVATSVSDKDVPVITGTTKEAGWTWEPLHGHHRTDMTFISPEGKRYVNANPGERADLLVDTLVPGFPKSRLKLASESKRVKKLKDAEAELERGEALIKKTRARKREARRARRAARKSRGSK